MYKVIQDGAVIATVDSIVFIFYGDNQAYQECPEEQACGFCIKIPKSFVDDITGETVEISVDTVFQFPNKQLKGTEPIAEYSVV